MTVDDPFKRSTLGSGIFCKDPRAALIWLENAFGSSRAWWSATLTAGSSIPRCGR
ncbi:hypothetical protein MES4922_190462 [Mesorhizobium ventifaucium]|uniref:Uncharacterized protein n=1 Tax=Mesorhizobium ventifaucium TaxID=666020 RepID=A0ABM9DMW3_9HYPH|nr:hypothetical protein MES4922_190462 [Mesorhizobium ventifaucium]